MSDDDEAAAAAFDVLSDPTRVAILRELADLSHSVDGSTVEFSELRRAVGVDDAGRFNYHLGKLRDRFVVKRDGGYVPTAVGLKAIGSVEAGTYTEDVGELAGEVDHDCPACGDPLTATYEDQVVTVECPHDDVLVQTSVPPATAADATIDDVVSFVVGDLQRDVEAMADGVCPICSGRMVVDDFADDDGDHLRVALECRNCWMAPEFPVGVLAVRHPAVVALYHDHGVDVRRQFLTDLEFVGSRSDAALVSESPPVAELTVEVGGDAVDLRVHDDLAVEAV
ncbi:winged helix-turn-helix domain-containing protein [Halobacterium yunchengense]|uniref:winged helix-turn-helix domain-containing protein n=1 Tax=Halobacterium yunchengense TaxID=3108497 RepID=UPI00300A22D4